ncbi:sulfotransferase [Mesorhizobium sp. BR115XR7A]|uniref:sulfotransferase family protein n=1 Tax=Mesorhizobium sp. BR115XR7A TaxID=2876645 RepID=UPI001CC9EBDE|nr:sulfotransferase [Mesorhizobium sp. BR115XR7A]MBZ9909334.1 sulfotransferase [Mesorhizobium sp. BR115XR7A]MBZ9932614.1 sulfotransferase [Mesorhizobium sp. BR1-1-5]
MQVAYLLGIPRSGTTLFSALLNQHPQIHCPSEPWTMLAVASLGLVPAPHAADMELIRNATEPYLADMRLRGEIAMNIYRRMLVESPALWLVDKTPRYHHCLDFIRKAMPEARYFWMIRNPLDVAASYKSTWANDVLAALRDGIDHPILFDFALGFRRLIDFARENDVHLVRYEELVRDPASVMSGVFGHLGLEVIDLDSDIRGGLKQLQGSAFGDMKIVQTHSVHPNSVGRYLETLSVEDTRLLCAYLGREVLADLGYPELYDMHDAGSIPHAQVLPERNRQKALELEAQRQGLSLRPYRYWQRQRQLAAEYHLSRRRQAASAASHSLANGGPDQDVAPLRREFAELGDMLQSRIAQLQEAVEKRLTSPGAPDIDLLRLDLAALRQELQGEVVASRATMMHGIADLTTKVEGVTAALTNLGNLTSQFDLYEKITRLEHLNAEMRESNALQTAAAAELEREKDEARSNAEVLSGRLDDAQKLRDELEGRISQAAQEVHRLKSELKALRKSPLVRLFRGGGI